MKIVGFVVLASVCLILTHGQMGPFDCEVRSFQPAPPSKSGKNLIFFRSRQQKLSRKKYNLLIDGQLNIVISDDLTANVNVAKKTPQGWKENFFQLEAGPACSALKKFVPGITKDLAIGMKLKKHECPYPRGNYTDVVVNPELDIQGIPGFFYSVFRLRIAVSNKTGVLGAFDVMLETSPKKPR
uniref:Phosphate acyltransferase n=1 Tax=Lygus hesperus TaxID=30085 RepID=A0A0A9WJ82_LYGHE